MDDDLVNVLVYVKTIRVVAVAPMRLRLCFTINAFLFIHGVRGETLSGVLNCLTLPMLHVLAQMNNAEALVPALRTKQRAVQVLTAHFSPLCTPVAIT